MDEKILNKLRILADSAKYDVSCSSSGSGRARAGDGTGNAAPMGCCHTFTEDGRCVSLLKVLLTNVCIYDCAYCINRRSNDIPRATMKVTELVELTINFYRRNYIEGLFLSSGVILSPDYTMEAMLRVAKALRTEQRFGGYIHLKAIAGASPELLHEAGLYADRMSVNIEIPSENNLKLLAPEKNFTSVLQPMNQLKVTIEEHKEARKKTKKAPLFVPAGQSTQLIVGASPDNDRQILTLASGFYNEQNLKRVYYSGFIPVNAYDQRLPALTKAPLLREHRLYQADFLLRKYGFAAGELVFDAQGNFDLAEDPKLAWARRHPERFPVPLATAAREELLRVPGLGATYVERILAYRRHGRITSLADIGLRGKNAEKASRFCRV